MFDRREEIRNITTFGCMSIIRAMLETLPIYDLQRIRAALDPHWSDGYNPPLDQYFTPHNCKLCDEVVLNRKRHFHEECEIVKMCRKQSLSIEEFEEALWSHLAQQKQA